MKKIILGLFSLMFCITMYAQNNVQTAATTATDKLVALYQLNPEQTTKVLKIQERRYRHIETLESIKASQPELYYKKRASVEKGITSSMQRILNDEQEVTLKDQLVKRRANRAVLMKKMYAEGASSTAIQNALLEVE